MKHLAIDIVLLPDTQITHLAIEANQSLITTWDSDIRLHPQACLPHISLAMARILQPDLGDIQKALTSVWQAHAVTTVQAQGVTLRMNDKGIPVSSLTLKPTQDLQRLHEAILNTLNPLLRNDGILPSDFTGQQPISQTSLDWVTHYQTQSSFDHFWPHITLGYGELDTNPFPDLILCQALALCHLGNHCTCQRVLARWETCAEKRGG